MTDNKSFIILETKRYIKIEITINDKNPLRKQDIQEMGNNSTFTVLSI